MKNTFLKVLSFVMALTMLVSVFGTNVFAVEEHEHVYVEKTVAATCKTPGYTYKVCACGDVEGNNYYNPVEPLEECAEADLEDLPATDATCTEPAYAAGKKCKVCGKEYHGDPITDMPALNHDYELVIVEPDCGVEGKISKVCQREGCGFEVVLQVINDDATCNQAGVTADTTAHTYAYVILKAPTCTEKGYAKYYCTKCGDVIEDQIPALAIGHAYGAWVIDSEATCGQAGSKHKTCANCGDVQRETIPAKQHDWKNITEYHDCVADRNGDDDYTNDVLKFQQTATCYQDGYVWQHCSACDAIQQVPTAKTAHDWIENGRVNVGTVQKPSYVYYTGTYVEHSACAQVTHYYNKCEDCGYVEIIEELEEKADHVWEKNADNSIKFKADVTPAADKVCVTTVNYYKVCTECGFELLDHAAVAQGHVWEDRFDEDGELQWTYVPYQGTLKPCELGAANYYIRECTVCDATEEVCKFTMPHVKDVYTCDTCTGFCTDCTHAGRKLTCSVCNEKFGDVCTQESHNLEAHANATLKTPADCNSKAVYTYECTNANCAHKEDKEYGEVNPEVHDAASIMEVETSPATCTVAGTRYFICFHCDPSKTIEEEIPALGHKHVAVGTAKAATCMEEGLTAGDKCERCGEVFVPQTVIPVNNNAHVGTATIVYETNATCQFGIVKLESYSVCGHVALVTEGENTNPVNHVNIVPVDSDNDGKLDRINYSSSVETVAAVGATCTTDGMHGYTRCTLCDVLVTVEASTCADAISCTTKIHNNLEKLEEDYELKTAGDITTVKAATIEQVKFNDVKAQLVIAKYGHNYKKTLVPYKSETCVDDGNKAKIQCTRCDAIDPNNDGSTIEAHGTTGSHITVITEYLAPTCTATGEDEGTWCTKCAAQVAENACSACLSDGGHSYVIPANGHNVTVTSFAQSCTTEGFDMYKCTACDALTAAAGEKVNGRIVTTTTMLWYFENYKAAAHTWADTTTTIAATCTDAEKTVYNCQFCTAYDATRVTVSETVLATGHTVGAENVKTLTCEQTCDVCNGTGHNIVTTAPTCENKGYDFCLNCNYKANEVPAIGHKYDYTISYVEETSLADGLWTWACQNCDEVQECVLEYTHEVEFDIVVNPYVDGKDAADLEFVKGGYIEVIVNVTLEDTTFSGLEYSLNYNAQYLEFVSVECVYDFGEVAYDLLKTDNGDNVKTTVHFNGVAGVLGGEETALFRYIFKVAPATNYVDATIIGHGAIAFDEETSITITKTDLANKIDFVLMGDVNADGAYTVDDLIIIKTMFGKDDMYTNIADLDANGEVDVNDYRKFGKFVNSNKTLADYYTMFGYDIVGILANAVVTDMDGNGLINAVDRDLFEAGIAYLPATVWAADINIGFYDEYIG